MKKIINWLKPKPKQGEFNCTTCGRYYKCKHFEETHKSFSLFCDCSEIMTVYVNHNEVTNISIF